MAPLGPYAALYDDDAIAVAPLAAAATLIRERAAVTVIMNICAALVSTLPLAVAAGVNVNVPFDATAGPISKSAAFVLPVTANVNVCPLSFGPAEMAVAQPGTVCAPASSVTV